MSRIVSLSFLLLVAMTARAMPADTIANQKTIQVLERIEPLANEHLNVLKLFKLANGALPPDSQAVQQFINANHLNIEKRDWNCCKIIPRDGFCEIHIRMDSTNHSPMKMSDSSAVVEAVSILIVKEFMKGQKSSIVSLHRKLVHATVKNAAKELFTLEPFDDKSYMSLSKLSEDTVIRLTKSN